MKGTVKWFDNKKGYGFIQAEDGKDIFVHHLSIKSDGYRTLDQGEEVEFDIETTPKGRCAVNVIKND